MSIALIMKKSAFQNAIKSSQTTCWRFPQCMQSQAMHERICFAFPKSFCLWISNLNYSAWIWLFFLFWSQLSSRRNWVFVAYGEQSIKSGWCFKRVFWWIIWMQIEFFMGEWNRVSEKLFFVGRKIFLLHKKCWRRTTEIYCIILHFASEKFFRKF